MKGYEALRTSAAILDVSDRGKIRVTGEDRARLLHAMSTQHVSGLEPDRGCYAFFLSDKGRILTDAYIYNLGDSLWLDTEPETRGKLFDHLDRFIIADDVTLEDETQSFAAISVEGPNSLAMAEEAGLPVGDKLLDMRRTEHGFTVRVSVTGGDGLRIFCPAAERETLLASLSAAGAIDATADEARLVRIENGRARYGEEIGERYLVQETQVPDAVHSNKGCYLGQEIVERVRARGQVHRLLTAIRIETQTPLPAGTKLVANGVDAGEISSSVFSPARGEVVGLAYLRTEAAHCRPEMTVAGSEAAIKAFVL